MQFAIYPIVNRGIPRRAATVEEICKRLHDDFVGNILFHV